MIMQEEIKKRQNEPEMLKCQFAARYYFNQAEKFFDGAFVSSFLAFLLGLLPDLSNNILSAVCTIFPPLLGIASWVLLFFVAQFVKNAALLRGYFDDQVLGFRITDGSESTLRKIKQLTNRVIKKHKNEYEAQAAHTSQDTPPGVKDWYEFSKDFPDSDVVFECQRQNQWWTKKLSSRRLVLYCLAFVATIVMAVSLYVAFHVDLWKIVGCLLGFIGVVLDAIVANIQYATISKEIDGAIKILERSKNAVQIEGLQGMICKRREIPALEMNLLHKRKSKMFSAEYGGLSE